MLQGLLPKITTEVQHISGGVRRILISLKTFKKCYKILSCSFFQTRPLDAYKVHFHLVYYAHTVLREIQFTLKALQILLSLSH